MSNHEIPFNTNLPEEVRTWADFTYKIAAIPISVVDSGSGQCLVIEDIGKLSTGTQAQIGSFKESLQRTRGLRSNGA